MSMGKQIIASTCWECNTTCGSLVTVEGDRAVDIRPNRAHPHSKGAFCAKGIRGLMESTYSGSRLTHPLRRAGARGDGEWTRISWDEALDEMAHALARVRERHGAEAIAGAVSGAYFSRGAVMALLMRSLGSPNWMINQDLCGGCRALSDRVTGLAITGGEDIDAARCALVVGRNPAAADPVQWRALNALRQRGGTLVVIDPVRTSIADRADLWLRPRPGTDSAIALALLHVLIAQERYDSSFVQQWCHGFDQLAERVRNCSPSWAAEISGVPAEDIGRAASAYADGPSTFVSGHGIDAFTAGFQTFRAFHALVAISGNLDRAGGNRRIKKPPGFRQYLELLHDPENRLPHEVERRTLGADRFPLWAGPRGWQTACHNPSVIDAMLSGKPYPVRALYVSGVNIAVTYPDSARTLQALRSLDFLAVASHTMNPTAAWADIVLPKTTGLEEEEISLAAGGPCISYTAPAHAPVGEARTDLAIASGLVSRLQALGALYRIYLPWTSQAEFNGHLVGSSGIDMQALKRDGYVSFPFELGNFAAQGFATPSGKLELYSETLASLGFDPLPGYEAPARDGVGCQRQGYPLTLLTGEREKNYHHSRFRDQAWARARSPEPRLRIHPRTAAEQGLYDGQWVALETSNVQGQCKLQVMITDRLQPGVVSTGMGWWRPEAEAPGFDALTININAVLSYSGPTDPVTGSIDSRGIPCRLRGVTG